MHALLAALGSPQKAWQAVHVAGTKGKGSTAALLSSILTQSQLDTGLYTRSACCSISAAASSQSCYKMSVSENNTNVALIC